MTRFEVYEADVWGECDSYTINMYYPIIETYTGEQLIIDISEDADDIDIINTLINNQTIDDNILNQDNYIIEVDYQYNDIIITMLDDNDIESSPIIIKLEEL